MNQMRRALDSLERNTDGVTVASLQRAFGAMAVEGLFAHGYVRVLIDDRYILSGRGHRCLHDARTH